MSLPSNVYSRKPFRMSSKKKAIVSLLLASATFLFLVLCFTYYKYTDWELLFPTKPKEAFFVFTWILFYSFKLCWHGHMVGRNVLRQILRVLNYFL